MQSFETLNMTRGDKAGQTSSTSPSLSSPSNAASRQKSCNACVRGKRRCDKTAPRCTRCAAKGLECVYQRIPPGSSASAVTLAQSSARLSEAADSGYKPASAELTDDDFEMGGFDASDLASVYGRGHGHDGRHGMAGGNSSTSTSTSPDLVLDPSLDFSIADLLGASSCSSAGTGSGAGTGTMTTPDADSSSSMVGLWNLPGFDEPKADFPTLTQSFSFSESPFLLQPQPQPQLQQQQQQHQPQQQQQQQKQIIRDVTILNNARDTGKCFTLDPLLIHDPRSNVGYMTNHFTTMHCDFVRSRALPFAHPRLYTHNMPKTIMAAYCGAAAYTSRSPATRAWAFRAVQDATAEVHREGASATSPLEKLARCHALFVLESIRIFDGDIALRYASERERPLLKEWTLELLEVVKGFGDSALAKVDMEQSPATWNTWIFEESVKRTASVGLAFQCFLSILRSETPDISLMMNDIPYTASQPLWGATTSVEFFRAWREQPRWIIRMFDYKEFWQYARPEDMCEFTKIMLAVQTSPDAVDHFLQGDTTIPVNMTFP